jgi:hypothetical protein
MTIGADRNIITEMTVVLKNKLAGAQVQNGGPEVRPNTR